MPKRQLPEGASAALFFLDGQYRFVAAGSGRETAKYLGPSAVVAAFAGECLDSGWIAPEIVRHGFRRGAAFSVAFIPPGTREIRVVGPDPSGITLRVPVPALCAIGSQQTLTLVATREDVFDPGSAPFYPPFPNLLEGARVCWGANNPPRLDHESIVAAVDLYFSTAFNLNESANRSLSHPGCVVEKLARLARRRARRYPVDDLVRIDGASSVGELVDRIVAGRKGERAWN